MTEWHVWALTGTAAVMAGVLNAVAGGGSFLTLPALIWAGLPPVVANATSAVAVSPGYMGSTWGYREELKAIARTGLRRDVIISFVAGIAGAGLLLATPERLFTFAIPWLLLFATLLFAMAPSLTRWAREQAAHPHLDSLQQSTPTPGWRTIGLGLVGIYGGYFNGGLGILLMTLYAVGGEARIQVANALKNLHSLVLSVGSVVTFIMAGAVDAPFALWMMLCATLGGYFGAQWARRMSGSRVRGIVIATGAIMTILFFVRTSS